MIKSILKIKYSSYSQTARSFSTFMRSALHVSATDKGGEGLTSSTQGHSGNTSRELSFEEQYAAKRDYELLKKLADLSNDQSKRVSTLIQKIEESSLMNSEIQNLQHNIIEMKGIIDESFASTRVANIDVSSQQSIPEKQTPWKSQSTQQPKTIENIANLSGSTVGTTNDQNTPQQTKFMDKSFYPDITNDI